MCRKTCLADNLFDSQCASWYVGSMLQHTAITRSKSRRKEPEKLPERKVPGHYSQNNTNRLESDKAFTSIRFDDLILQVFGGIGGIVLAHRGTFVYFSYSLAYRLAHFLRHQ